MLSAWLLLFMACMGAACVRSSAQWLSLVALLVGGLVAWGRASHRPRKDMAVLTLMLCMVSARCGTGAMPQPQLGIPACSFLLMARHLRCAWWAASTPTLL